MYRLEICTATTPPPPPPPPRASSVVGQQRSAFHAVTLKAAHDQCLWQFQSREAHPWKPGMGMALIHAYMPRLRSRGVRMCFSLHVLARPLGRCAAEGLKAAPAQPALADVGGSTENCTIISKPPCQLLLVCSGEGTACQRALAPPAQGACMRAGKTAAGAQHTRSARGPLPRQYALARIQNMAHQS